VTALMVVGSNTLSPGDEAVRDRFLGLGFTGVLMLTDSLVTPADATGKQLVLISESAVSANVGSRLNATTAPILNLEPALQDDLGMTGPTWGSLKLTNGVPSGPLPPVNSQHGTVPGTGVYLELGIPSILTAGLPTGMVVMVNPSLQTFNWGFPGRGATIVTRTPPRQGSSAGVPTSYVYERNSTLDDGSVAPGKRGQFYTGATLAAIQSAESWLLFDAMVNWARQ